MSRKVVEQCLKIYPFECLSLEVVSPLKRSYRSRVTQDLTPDAGITGLLIAQGLKKVPKIPKYARPITFVTANTTQQEGIPCTVFESEPSASHYRAAEWGMSIQWGIPLLQKCLPEDLFDRLQSAANDPYFTPPDPGVLPTLNGKTGELLKDVPLLRMFRVSRRKFRALCAEGISVEVCATSRR